MAHISWIGRLLGESDGVITHVKFLAKVATLFRKEIWLCHGSAFIHPPRVKGAQDSGTRRQKKALPLCGNLNSSWHIFTLKFWQCVQGVSCSTHANPQHESPCHQTTTYVSQVLRSWLPADIEVHLNSEEGHSITPDTDVPKRLSQPWHVRTLYHQLGNLRWAIYNLAGTLRLDA